jgi:hypothetical protein
VVQLVLVDPKVPLVLVNLANLEDLQVLLVQEDLLSLMALILL